MRSERALSVAEDRDISPVGDGRERAAELAERAAMCMGCLGRRGIVREGLVPILCEGRRVEARVYTGSCPRGKHADELGRTRWLGVRWRGVPLPLRWWARLLTRGALGDRAMRPRDYRGCGCVDALKRWAERLTPRVRRR